MRNKVLIAGLIIALLCLLAAGMAAGGALLWRRAPDLFSAGSGPAYQGISIEREVRSTPRPLVIHIVTVDLNAPGIGVLVTPGDPQDDYPLRAQTTSRYLDEYDLQLAINGDGFIYEGVGGLVDDSPEPGNPADVIGYAASEGEVYSRAMGDQPVLYFTRGSKARFNEPFNNVYNAISGDSMLVERGASVAQTSSDIHPRTAVALDRPNRRLMLFVIDGRQPGYSEGVTLAELAEIIIEHGGYTAMNMDGGGSTTLVVAGSNGSPNVINSPIHQGIPGRERPVANHLGFFARPRQD